MKVVLVKAGSVSVSVEQTELVQLSALISEFDHRLEIQVDGLGGEVEYLALFDDEVEVRDYHDASVVVFVVDVTQPESITAASSRAAEMREQPTAPPTELLLVGPPNTTKKHISSALETLSPSFPITYTLEHYIPVSSSSSSSLSASNQERDQIRTQQQHQHQAYLACLRFWGKSAVRAASLGLEHYKTFFQNFDVNQSGLPIAAYDAKHHNARPTSHKGTLFVSTMGIGFHYARRLVRASYTVRQDSLISCLSIDTTHSIILIYRYYSLYHTYLSILLTLSYLSIDTTHSIIFIYRYYSLYHIYPLILLTLSYLSIDTTHSIILIYRYYSLYHIYPSILFTLSYLSIDTTHSIILIY